MCIFIGDGPNEVRDHIISKISRLRRLGQAYNVDVSVVIGEYESQQGWEEVKRQLDYCCASSCLSSYICLYSGNEQTTVLHHRIPQALFQKRMQELARIENYEEIDVAEEWYELDTNTSEKVYHLNPFKIEYDGDIRALESRARIHRQLFDIFAFERSNREEGGGMEGAGEDASSLSLQPCYGSPVVEWEFTRVAQAHAPPSKAFDGFTPPSSESDVTPKYIWGRHLSAHLNELGRNGINDDSMEPNNYKVGKGGYDDSILRKLGHFFQSKHSWQQYMEDESGERLGSMLVAALKGQLMTYHYQVRSIHEQECIGKLDLHRLMDILVHYERLELLAMPSEFIMRETFVGRVIQLAKEQATYVALSAEREGLLFDGVHLCVHGESGTGKSALLAAVAARLSDHMPVIVRFCGGVNGISSSLRLLQSLCDQLRIINGPNNENGGGVAPVEYSLLVTHFHQLMALQPVILILDGIDELKRDEIQSDTSIDFLQYLNVPPKGLVIVSSGGNSADSGVIQQLQSNAVPLFEISALPEDDHSAVSFVKKMLSTWGRMINDDQCAFVTDRLKDNRATPMYLRLIAHVAASWRSTHEPYFDNIVTIESTISGMVNHLLQKLEDKHGTSLVRLALALLTFSESGLKSTELEDVLSLDDTVVHELIARQHNTKTVLHRVPSGTWLKLCLDLHGLIYSPHLGGRLSWRDASVKSIAQERYKEQLQIYCHSLLGTYFTNRVSSLMGNHIVKQRELLVHSIVLKLPKDEHEKSVWNISGRTGLNARRFEEGLPHIVLAAMANDKLVDVAVEELCDLEVICAIFLLEMEQKWLRCANKLLVHMRETRSTLSNSVQMLDNFLEWVLRSQEKIRVDPRLNIFETVQQESSTSLARRCLHRYFTMSRHGQMVGRNVGRVLTMGGPDMSLSAAIVLRGHTDRILCIAWSPDGCYLASGSDDCTVRTWEVSGFDGIASPRCTLSGHGERINALCFSPDGDMLASASDEKVVRIWTLRDVGSLVREIDAHERSIESLDWSPNGLSLVTGSADRTIKVWNVPTGKLERVLSGHPGDVRAVKWSPSGHRLASGSDDWTVRVWEGSTEIQRFHGHDDWVKAIVWSPDGKQLASASGDMTVRIWALGTASALQVLTGHEDYVTGVSWTRTDHGDILASGSYDGTIRLWIRDAQMWQVAKLFTGHQGYITDVSISLDGFLVASAGYDKTVQIWDTSNIYDAIPSADQPQSTTQTSPSSPKNSSSRMAAVLEPLSSPESNASPDPSPSKTAESKLKCAPLRACAFTPDGKRIATASEDNVVHIFVLKQGVGRLVRTLEGHRNHVDDLSWSPDGQFLASTAEDSKVLLWHSHTGMLLGKLRGHAHPLNSIAWSSDGTLMAGGSMQKLVIIWDIAQGKVVRTLHGHAGDIRSVAWSPDGTMLASSSNDWTVRVWDVLRETEVLCMEHSDWVTCVRWDSSGRRIAAAVDHCIYLYELGNLIGTIDVAKDDKKHGSGDKGVTESLCWSPNGHFIAASLGNILKIFDVRAMAIERFVCIRLLEGHDGVITSIDWSHDGMWLATAARDGTVRLWEGDELEKMKNGRPRLSVDVKNSEPLSSATLADKIASTLGRDVLDRSEGEGGSDGDEGDISDESEIQEDDFPSSGLTSRALRVFMSICGGEAMLREKSVAEVRDDHVRLLTEATTCSYVSLLELQGSDEVGEADYFVIVSDNALFLDVYASLERHFESKPRTKLWLDCFCLNQHTHLPRRSFFSNGFKAFLLDIKHACLVASPWETPQVAFSDPWCILQLHTTLAFECHFDLCIDAKDFEQLLTGEQDDFVTFLDMLSTLDTKSALENGPRDACKMVLKCLADIKLIFLRVHTDSLRDVSLAFSSLGESKEIVELLSMDAVACDHLRKAIIPVFHRASNVNSSVSNTSMKGPSMQKRTVLASILSQLGDNAGALGMLFAHLEKQNDFSYDQHHISMAQCYMGIGEIYFSQGRYKASLAMFEKAITVCTSYMGGSHECERCAAAHLRCGRCLLEQGMHDQAIQRIKIAYQMHQSVGGKTHGGMGPCLRSLAEANLRYGHFDESLRCLYEEAKLLSSGATTVRLEHQELVGVHLMIGCVHEACGRIREALDTYHKALAIVVGEDLSGTHSSMASDVYLALGACMMEDRSSTRECLSFLTKSFWIRRKIFGSSHDKVVSVLLIWGKAYGFRQKYTVSTRLFTVALDICRRGASVTPIRGDNESLRNLLSHTHFGGSGTNRHGDYHFGEYDDGNNGGGGGDDDDDDDDDEFGEGLDEPEVESGAQKISLSLARCYCCIASMHGEMGSAQYKLAIREYEYASSIFMNLLGRDHPDVGNAYVGLGKVHSANSHYEKAVDMYNKGLDIYLIRLRTTHPVVAETYHYMATTLMHQGVYEESRRTFIKSLDIRKRVMGVQSKLVAKTIVDMALCDTKAQTSKADECLRLYDTALQILRGSGADVRILSYDECAACLVQKARAHVVLGENVGDALSLYEEALIMYTTGAKEFTGYGTERNVIEVEEAGQEEYCSDIVSVTLLICEAHEVLGDKDKALQWAEKAVKYQEKCHVSRILRVPALTQVATLLSKTGNHIKSIANYDAIFEIILQDAVGGDTEHDDLVPICMRKAATLCALNRKHEAVGVLDHALRIRATFYDDSSCVGLIEVLDALAQVHLSMAQHEECRSVFARMAHIIEIKYGSPSTTMADHHFKYATVLRKQGDREAALRSYSLALDERKSLFGDKHPSTFEVLDEMARTTTNPEQTVDFFRRALTILRENPDGGKLHGKEQQTDIIVYMKDVAFFLADRKMSQQAGDMYANMRGILRLRDNADEELTLLMKAEAEMYVRAGEKKKAREVYDQCIKALSTSDATKHAEAISACREEMKKLPRGWFR